MHYYIPLPLHLASNDEASNKHHLQQQAILLSVLLIYPSHSSRLYSTLATSSGGTPNLHSFGPSPAMFPPKTGCIKERSAGPHTHGASEKRPQTAPEWPKICACAFWLQRTKTGWYLGLCSSRNNSEGTQSIHNPPLFVVSNPQNHPTGRQDPRTRSGMPEPVRAV